MGDIVRFIVQNDPNGIQNLNFYTKIHTKVNSYEDSVERTITRVCMQYASANSVREYWCSAQVRMQYVSTDAARKCRWSTWIRMKYLSTDAFPSPASIRVPGILKSSNVSYFELHFSYVVKKRPALSAPLGNDRTGPSLFYKSCASHRAFEHAFCELILRTHFENTFANTFENTFANTFEIAFKHAF